MKKIFFLFLMFAGMVACQAQSQSQLKIEVEKPVLYGQVILGPCYSQATKYVESSISYVVRDTKGDVKSVDVNVSRQYVRDIDGFSTLRVVKMPQIGDNLWIMRILKNESPRKVIILLSTSNNFQKEVDRFFAENQNQKGGESRK